jgi:uncharacterized membrane protein
MEKMKENRMKIIITSLITLAPILIGVLFWDRLPDQIATHFGQGNVPDGWSSKPMAVFGLPLILVALHLFCIFITLNDPKKKNIGRKILPIIFWMIPIISLLVNSATYGIALGLKIDIELIVSLLLGLLFIIFGNYMSKIRQNYTVGIRLPWTLSSEDNWDKTHRLAGKLWIVGGVLVLFNIFLKWTGFLIGILLVIVFVPMVYSYALYWKARR